MDTYRMWRIKLEIILLLLLFFFFQGRAQVKNDTTQSKTKFFDKISTHWVPTYLISDPDFMYEQRNDFKSKTFVEVYIEGAIAKNVWLFNNLNRITELRNEQKQTPHILIKVLFKPENETFTQYSVNLNVTASQKLPVDLAGMTSQAASQHLNKTIYKEPLDAINDIEKAVAQILQNLKTSLGNSLAPNLLLRYNNDIYWSGHEITVLANEGNSAELEALDKNLQPIPSSELTWTNASPFMHKGVVDLTGLNTQQVSVQHKQGRQTDIAFVTLKRVNVTENINDLLKLLIIEVLSVKKQEAQDSVVRLKNDSIANAQSISRAILALESQNFPLEGGETPMALFNEGAQLLLQADEALFNNNTQRVTSFNLLKRRKALREGIRKKVNVVAFANLIVDQPEKVELLLDGLLRSSGQLVAQLILNQDQNGMRTAARNIVVDYLNKNIEAVAGSTFGFAQPGEPPLQLSPNTTNNNIPIFKPDTYLHLNPMLDFEGKSEFITETNNYLSSLSDPLYVFINYSHDVSTESYLQRASATRPKGLPDGVRFIALTLINIPGSTKFQLVGNKTIQLESAHSVREILKLYLNDKETFMVAAKKPKPVVIIADNTMTEGKVYVHNTKSNQIKVKFETSDTTKTKIVYQLSILVESTETTIHYPTTGYDTLVYNQVKEITLDSIPQGKYTLLCKAAKADYTLNFFIRKQKLEITKEQLKTIFPTTDDKRIEEVVKSINENSSTYDISTPERMAHFLGQIGAETGGLKKLKESPLYSPRTVVAVFPYPKYGHLFENISLDSTTYNYSYRLINYDESKCNGEEMNRGTTIFPYSNSSEIVNAYAATKSDTLEVTLSGKKTKVLVYKKRTDATKDNIRQKVTDDDYNSGLLKVKSKYIRSAALFDVTYGCRMGNGNVASKDGSTYLGKGFIHITGKGGYEEVSVEWNKLYPNDKKEFHGKDINLLETDVEVAIKASMVYWKIKNLNKYADIGIDDKSINDLGAVVNGTNPPNSADTRKSYTKSAHKTID